MLRAVGGMLVAGGLVAALYLLWSGSPFERVRAAGGSGWQLRELALLKAAYDRMQREAAPSAEAGASLDAERERIVRQIAATARLLPAGSVPAELRALLSEAEPAAVSPAAPMPPSAAGAGNADPAAMPAPDLRTGLRVMVAGRPGAAGAAGEFAIDPELREPIAQDPGPQPEERPARRKPRDAARRSQP